MSKYIYYPIIILLCALFLFLSLSVKNGEFSFQTNLITIFRLPEIFLLSVGTTGAVIATYMIHLLTKNKAAGIGTMGISSINLLIFSIVYGLTSITTYLWLAEFILPIVYVAGSFGLMLIIYLLTFKFRQSTNKIILIGIVMALLISAISYMIISNLSAPKQEHVISVSTGSIQIVANIYYQTSTIIALSCIALGILLGIIFYKQIILTHVSEIKAHSLGINIKLVRFIMMFIIGLCGAAAFIALGAIAFIGFVGCNLTYIFVKKVGFMQLFTSLITGLALMYFVYFLNSSWMGWYIAIGIVSNIIAIPYLIIVLWKGN